MAKSKKQAEEARKRGRPESFTPEQVIDALQKARGIHRYAARSLGCNRKTIANMAKRYPEIADVVYEEVEGLIDTAEAKLSEAIARGELPAIVFFLKTRAKHRGYVERGELTGAGGKPLVEPPDYSKLTDNEIMLLHRLVSKMQGKAE